MTWVEWKLILLCLEMVLNLAQDMCTVCAECSMGVEIVLAVPNGTPGDVGWEARFSLFGDCVSLDAR